MDYQAVKVYAVNIQGGGGSVQPHVVQVRAGREPRLIGSSRQYVEFVKRECEMNGQYVKRGPENCDGNALADIGRREFGLAALEVGNHSRADSTTSQLGKQPACTEIEIVSHDV